MPSDFERMLRDVPATFPRPADTAKHAASRRIFPRRPPRFTRQRLSLLTAAAVCAAATIGFTAGHWLVPARGEAATAVSLAATQELVTVGGRFTLFGTLTSGRADQSVVIEARSCGASAFHAVGEARTVAGGAFGSELGTYPERATEYRARWHGGVSTPVMVDVRPRIDLQYSAGTLHVQVWAGAIIRDRRAIMQMFDAHGGPQTLRTFVIRNTGYGTGGDATVRVRLPRDRIIRVVLPQIGPCFADGISPPVTT